MSEAHVINFPDKPDRGGEKEGQDGYRAMSIVREKIGGCQYLPIVCPNCGAEVGLIEAGTGKYILMGNYCKECGQPLKGIDTR